MKTQSVTKHILLLTVFVFSLISPMMATPVQADTVDFTGEELLGRPTDSSITINIVPASTIEYYYEYGTTQGGPYPNQTLPETAIGGDPHEVVITGLTPNTRYYYRMIYDGDEDVDDGDYEVRPEYTFQTQRAEGESFVFTVTSDSHGSFGTNTATNILNGSPDFHVDLGDTFMIDTLSETQSAYNGRYATWRGTSYFGGISPSVPIYLTTGNHEEEEGWNLDDTPSRALLNIEARKFYFPMPNDDGFYSASTDTYAGLSGDQLRENYYAWEWGDALFVVIDEFQYTMELPYAPGAAGEGTDDPQTGDQWSWTLGETQYNWLKQTLTNSDAKYKFVFSHNMLGGIPNLTVAGVGPGYVRGGAKGAPYFEWGGYNADDSWGFDTQRPGWDKPIHQLFIENGVSAYFHGHDHQYVHETRDGVVYQEVPSAGNMTGFSGIYTEGDYTDFYGDYSTVEMLSGNGHLRISVTPTEATVSYILSSGTASTYTYTIEPNQVSTDPTITITGTPMANFSSEPGTPSAEQSYTVSGSNLTDDITITAPADFEISLTSGSGWTTSPLILTQSAGDVDPTPIYVRFNRATEGTSGGDITHTSTDATTQNVAVSGTAGEVQTGEVTLDGVVSSTTADGVEIISVSHTTGTSANRLMLVGVSVNNYSTEPTVESVSFNYDSTSLPLTQVGAINYEGRYVAIYGLVDPPSGQAGTVEVDFSEAMGYGMVAGVANFAGVDQTTPWGTFVSANAQSDSPSVEVTGLTGTEMVFDTVFMGAATIPTMTVGADQTELWNLSDNRAGGVASIEEAAGSSVTMSWATGGTSIYWAMGAVPINPAPAGTTYELTMAVDPAGSGTTDPAVGVRTYAENAVVDITATPSAGYAFDSWSGACTGTDPCSVTMDGDKSVTAHFIEIVAGAVTLDGAVSSTTADGVEIISVSHTTGTGANRLMLVGVSVNNYSTEPTVESVSFNYDSTSLPLTQVGAINYEGRYVAIYGLVDPPSGQAGTVEVDFSEAMGYGMVAGVANFAGVDQTTPWGTFVSANAQSDSPSVEVTGLTGTEMVFDTVFMGAATIPTMTVGADQTELWNLSDNRAGGVASIEEAAGSSVTMSWTTGGTSVYWAIGAVPINPAPAGTTYELTMAVDPADSGTTDPGVGVHTYAEGAVVSLSATPNSGYVFDGWTGNADCEDGSVTMNAAKSCTATFSVSSTPITFTGTELLGRPTDTSISISVVPDEDILLYYEYGTSSGVYIGQTDPTPADAGIPEVVVISGLDANTPYYYRMQYSSNGGISWIARSEHSFWTQRAAGSTFTFDITSDSHVNILLGNAETWTNTLNDVALDAPDFLLDLGDTFAMRSLSAGDVSGAEAAYKDQLPFFNIVSHSTPIFLAPGNHEQQEAWHLIGDLATSLPVIGTNAQKKFFLNPVPDTFYTGDTNPYSYLDGDQLREDYYAWTWGDALFVVINPYWYTTTKPYVSDPGGGESDTTGSGDAWDWTLGQEQFDWLKATLTGSSAKYKFVFSHQMVSDGSVSGQEDYGHAGANHAQYVEWGGYNEDGSTLGWDTERAGWGSEPIHQVMVANGVTAFFHGHDHQYAYEERDDVVYQAVPSAGFTGSGFNMYTTGSGYTIQALDNSGHLRVTVGLSETTVDYIRTGETSSAYTYTMEPTGGPSHTLTVAVDPSDAGTTTPEVGMHSYVEGKVVDITATPASGYQFDHWSGACTGSDTCQVTMTGDMTVTAHFIETVPGAITLDGVVSSTTADGASSISVSHITGTGTNRLLLMGVSVNNYSTEPTIESVSFNYDTTSLPLTQVGAINYEGRYVAIYGLVDPPSGQAGTVEVDFSEAMGYGMVAGVANFAGVDQTTPWGTFVSANAQSDSPSVEVTGLTGTEMVFDTVFMGAATIPTMTVGADQTELWNLSDNRAGGVASIEEAAGSSVTMSWATGGTSIYWAMGAVPINPAPAGTTYELTMAVEPSGSGTTDPAAGVHTYAEDEIVTISATAGDGYEFDLWTGDVAEPDSASTTVTMDTDQTVTAHFTANEYTVTVTVEGNGTVNNTPGNPYAYGQTATLEPAADPGSTFAGWSGPDAVELSDNGNGTWDLLMNADKAVIATFTEDELPQPLPIEVGDEWRYFKGTVEPGDGWNDAGFDDSSWLSGPSGFGYDDGDDNTVLSDMEDGYISVYARKEFTVADPGAIAALMLSMDYDDGFVAYLNGTEIARDNVTGTPPDYNTAADSNHEASGGGSGASPVETYNIDPGLLVAGTNVLAVQGHNQSIGSSDFSLIPTLTAVEPLTSWIAYNDLNNADDDNAANVTEHGYDAENATLKDFDTGQDLPVSITVVSSGGQTYDNGGDFSTESSDAYVAFDSIVHLAGVYQLDDTSDVSTITFNDLDPTKEYAITLTANRDDSSYADMRYTRVTIQGADTYVNASSSGVVVNSDASVSFSTGYNTVNGYVAKWTGITAADGSFSIESVWDDSLGSGSSNTKGYAMSAFKLELPPTDPTITISGTPLDAFSSQPGTPSEEQSYTVAGSNLTDDIEINAPTDFEISTTSGSDFGSSVTLTQSSGSVAATLIYVRFNRATEGTSAGDISHTSGTLSQNVPVSGEAAIAPTVATFQQGIDGYAGTVDTFIRGTDEGDTNFSAETDLEWDDNSGTTTDEITLIRFTDIFSSEGGLIPDGATIVSATLTYTTTDSSSAGGDEADVYESLVDWPESTVTWNNFGGDAGVDADEYENLIDSASADNNSTAYSIDVTASLQRWSADPSANLGWIFLPTGSDGVTIYSAEGDTPPKLTVTYFPPSTEPPAAPTDLSATAASFSQIDLSWTDNADNESGFEVWSADSEGTPGALLETVGANITNYSDIGLEPETEYCYVVRATNSVGDSAYTDVACATTQAAPTTVTIQVRVNQESDDAEEHLDDNSVDIGSTDLEMIYDDWYSGNGFDQEVGMRFQNVDVPEGATIVSAYIEFVADASDGGDGASALTIYGEAADNPATFAETDENITGRTKTTASAAWNPGTWTSGETYQTSDLTTIVQEIVNRDGWISSNAMVFIVTGEPDEQVRAESHEGTNDGADAPLLVIEYTTTTGPIITLTGTTLSAFSTTPGLPSAAQTYTVSGSNLEANINIDAPNGFELSTDGSTYFSELTLTKSEGSVESTTIYVRLTGDEGTFSGNITHESSGATTKNVAVNGTAGWCVTVSFQQGTEGYTGALDAHIRQNDPTYNYGATTPLMVDSDEPYSSDGYDASALLYWDISSIPTGSTIESASITVYVENVTDATPGYDLYEMTQAWVEGTGDDGSTTADGATWETYDGTNAWPGGAGGASDLGSAILANFAATETGSYQVDLDDEGKVVLENWVNTPANNKGFMIHAGEEDNGLDFTSKEGSTVANRPKLTITYCLAPTTPYIAVSGTLSPFSSTIGVASDEQSYTVLGLNLTDNLVITAPADFEISTTSGDGFVPSVSISPDGEGTVVATTIYVRFFRASSGASSGNITHASADATTRNIAVSGTAFSGPPEVFLVQPDDDAIGVTTPPTLQVMVTDPEEDVMSVSFYGRPVGEGGSGEDFTIFVYPDTQSHVDSESEAVIFNAMSNYVVAKQTEFNVAFATHVGDIVMTASNETEWQRADAAMDILDPAGVPYSVGPGNHDQNTTLYNQYFGSDRFEGNGHYQGPYATGQNENNYSFFSASGMDFILINLQYNSTSDHWDWADDLLKDYPDRRGIVAQHNILNVNNSWQSTASQNLYNALKDNPNLFLMLCGHMHSGSDGSAYRLETRTDMDPVHILLTDYQDYNSSGNTGYMRILTFKPATDEIYAQIYSPYVDAYLTDESNYEQFTMSYDMDGSAVFEQIGSTVNGVVSGANASIIWSDLDENTEYEWYVEVSDGSTTTTGSIWSFTSGGATANVAPVLDSIGNQNVNELVMLSFTTTATDDGLPSGTLSFSLEDGDNGSVPAGASITTGGAFSWMPTEAQGPGDYTFDICVSDGELSDCETITVTVHEVNVAPVLAAIGDKSVDELTVLAFTAVASDADVPVNALIFSLEDAPTGASITTDGVFSWTPIEAQGPDDYTFDACVSDGELFACETITVTVNEVNVAPILAEIGDKIVAEETELSFMATAIDADLPANTLIFSLEDAPEGASITTGGAFSWTPTEAQGPDDYTFTVIVCDDGAPSQCDEEAITVTVNEIPYDLYDLTIKVVGSGTTNPAVGVHTYAEDTVVNVTATANTGYAFDHWSGACTGTDPCQVAMDADKTVTAYFTSLTIPNIAPLATATASSQNTSTDQLASKAIDDVITGYPDDYTKEWATLKEKAGAWLQLTWSGTYRVDRIVLYDRPNTDDQILSASVSFSDGTSVQVGPLDNAGSGYEVTFDPKVITGLTLTINTVRSSTKNIGLAEIEVFGEADSTCYALTVSHTGEGHNPTAVPTNSAGCSAGQYMAGESISLSGAIADTGWRISGWTGTTNDASTASTNTVIMPASAHIASVTYAQDEHTLTIEVVGNGLVSKDPDQTSYHYEDEVVLEAIADPGWTFAGWSGDVSSSDNPLSLTITGDTTITAYFTSLTIPNIAPLATATASSQNTSTDQLASKAIDDVITGYPDDYTKEWATLKEKAGAWLQLTWSGTYRVDRIVLYDRPNTDDQILSASVSFSDGTSVQVGPLDNAGSGYEVTFDPKVITGLTLTINTVRSSTKNIGLAEIEVFGEADSTCYALTVSHTGEGHNPTAVPTNSAGCSAGQYMAGESISLSGAIADTGWRISGWTGTTNDASTASTNTVIMPASAHIASVTYAQDEHTLTIEVVGNGLVSKDPDQTSYHYEDEVVLEAIADPGWTFAGWSGDVSSSDNPLSLTITGDTTITAYFTSLTIPNIAPLATATASSQNTSTDQLASKAIDDVITGYPDDYTKEWATLKEKAGAWLQLTWSGTYRVDRIVLYDRPNTDDQILSASVSFSDGTSVQVGPLDNAGSGYEVTFDPKVITSLTLTINAVSSSTKNIGLAEIQVFGSEQENSVVLDTVGIYSAKSVSSMKHSLLTLEAPAITGFEVDTVDDEIIEEFDVDLMFQGALSGLVNYVGDLTGTVEGAGVVTEDTDGQEFIGLGSYANLSIAFDTQVKSEDIVKPEDEILNFAWLDAYINGVMVIDDERSNTVRSEVVPEPATVFFFGIGLFGIFALLRRRRRQQP